jgi:hypothetical protein
MGAKKKILMESINNLEFVWNVGWRWGMKQNLYDIWSVKYIMVYLFKAEI